VAPAPVTLRLDPTRSTLVVTSSTAAAPAFPHGVRVRGGVTASSDAALALGSFFTGRHLGMWARLAPHWPAPGPAWPQVLAARGRVEVVRFGRFGAAQGPYFREVPEFGFPTAFEDPEVSPLEAFLRTTDLVSRPFFAWVHLEGEAPAEVVSRLSEAATNGGFSVIWLHLPVAGVATVSVLDPARTAAAVDLEVPFAVPGVLPSLLPVPGHRTEFSPAPFPDVRHPRVTVFPGKEATGAGPDVRRLERRIRHAVNRRPAERWPSSPEKLGPFLEKLICSGRLGANDHKKITVRVQAFPHRRDLSERLDLLNWRMGLLDRPPDSAAGLLAGPWVRAWRRLTGGAKAGDEGTDPYVLAWTIALSGGGYPDHLLERCPGAPHTLPSTPGL
jgi:hypothetical protein